MMIARRGNRRTNTHTVTLHAAIAETIEGGGCLTSELFAQSFPRANSSVLPITFTSRISLRDEHANPVALSFARLVRLAFGSRLLNMRR